MEPEHVRVGTLAEIPEGELRAYELGGIRVAVAHLGGEVLAVADECTHLGCSLSDGELDDEAIVTCPCHGSRFDLTTGEPVEGPADEPIRVFLARVDSGWVEVAAAP
jgi:3-phenylpropionate/trans-cinnamate dioxygenase ferredoxin subunit